MTPKQEDTATEQNFMNILTDRYTLIYYRIHHKEENLLLWKSQKPKVTKNGQSFRLTLSHNWNVVQINPTYYRTSNTRSLPRQHSRIPPSPRVHSRGRRNGFNCPSSRTLLMIGTCRGVWTRVADRIFRITILIFFLWGRVSRESLWALTWTAQRRRRHQQGRSSYK